MEKTNLIDKVLFGEPTLKETEMLNEQMAIDIEMKHDYEDIKFLLENVPELPSKFELENHFYIGYRQIEYAIEAIRSRRRAVRKFRVTTLIVLVIAATMLAIVFQITNPVVSGLGKKEHPLHPVMLPDNSRITAQANSFYTFFHHPFGRTLTLSGQAYLRVAIDSLRPFIMKTGITRIKTFGAEVFLNIEPGELVKISVISGQIEVMGTEHLIAKAGESITQVSSGKTFKSVRHAPNFNTWYSGTIQFTQARLEDVIFMLEREYNVFVDLKELQDRNCLFTGTVHGLYSIDEVLEILCKSMDLKFHQALPGIYVLSGEGCSG